MGSNKKRGYIVDAVIFAVFTIIAFAMPFPKTSVFWLGYVFGVIAIAAQIYFFKISFSKGEDVKSKFYGFPIAKIGVIYLIVQLVLSLIEMIATIMIPVWIVIIINIIPVAFAIIGSIAADVMRDEVVRQDVQIKADVNNMRSLQSLATSLPGLCNDTSLKKELQDLSDEFRYSDPVSSDNTKELETELKFMLNEIQRTLMDGDIKGAKGFCTRTKAKLVDRNRMCKLGKNK